jgi:hypothetical protein
MYAVGVTVEYSLTRMRVTHICDDVCDWNVSVFGAGHVDAADAFAEVGICGSVPGFRHVRRVVGYVEKCVVGYRASRACPLSGIGVVVPTGGPAA